MKNLLSAIFLAAIILSSCKKDKENNDQNQAANSWTLTAQGTTYKGTLLWDPLLNTLLQGNNSYTFAMLGGEASTDRVFNIVLSLADTTFTKTSYQSGVSGTDDISAFYFTHGISGEDIYKSSDLDPGAVLNYTVESYNPSTRALVLRFSGNVMDNTGAVVPLTNGKVTCEVEKM